MGYSKWSDAAFNSRQTTRKRTGTTAFKYDKHVRQSGVVKIHPDMDPYGKIRESRDSADHPESVSIAVLFDVTGSMGQVPRVMQTKLGALMRVLIQKGYVEHPQVLFGGIGDAYCDRVPLQIGQFESGLEMDDDLGKIYIEGGGGGQVYESYELGVYFMARHTSIDCWEKRGKKGYLFTIGDEKPYDVVRKEQIEKHIGDKVQGNVDSADIFNEAQKMYEHFHIVPTNTAHGKNPDIHKHWRKYMGERVLILDDESAVCETIALAIALCEGTIDDLYSGVDDLVSAGYDTTAASAATSALKPYAKRREGSLVKVVAGKIKAAVNGGDDGRL